MRGNAMGWRARLALILITLTVLPSLSQAQESRFSVQQLAPMPDQRWSFWGVSTARVQSEGYYDVGIFFHYDDDPLVVIDENDDRVESIVGSQVTLNLLGSFGIVDRFMIGLDIPLILAQSGDPITLVDNADASGASFSLGDIRLIPKVLLFSTGDNQNPEGIYLSLLIDTYLPTGNQDNFQGEGFRVEPRILFDYVFEGGHVVAANLGYMIRPEAVLANVEVNDTFNFGVAGAIAVHEQVNIVPEIRASMSVLAEELNPEEVPFEALLGAKYQAIPEAMVEAGFAIGLNEGFGTPDWRAFLGVFYTASPDPDRDGDGILNEDDACPDDPEDFDEWEDVDGCPDPDNDGDTILDVDDSCPNDPEDFDEWEDADGCPDPDNDGDGILDDPDECPNDPEDFDQWEDADGCPDPDNDGDGILDDPDECPNVPETENGFEDEDGCPDEVLIQVTCEAIEIRDKVYFELDSDVIQERSFDLLNQVARTLNRRDDILLVRVEGHTDSQGSGRYNLDLSQRRAASVMSFIIDRGGVVPTRLLSEGYGEDRPIDDNGTQEGRANNRRVEFIIVEQEGCDEGE